MRVQYKRSVSNWIRVVQRLGDTIDEETGKRVLEIEEVPVTMIREDFGHTSVFAETEKMLEGLKRVHIYHAA